MTPSARPPTYTLLLTGGGARGLAHVGALRALEREGLPPAAVVGVSMGAIVGAVYALNPDWYRRLLDVDLDRFHHPHPLRSDDALLAGLRVPVRVGRVLRAMVAGWGIGAPHAAHMREVLAELTLGRDLADGPLPLRVTATDLGSGRRVAFGSGDAAERLYASAALPGVFPPLERGGRQLVDGGISDNAPVDLARGLAPGPVVVVDVTPPLGTNGNGAGDDGSGGAPGNGAHALLRALRINLDALTRRQLRSADLVLRPEVPFGTLEFEKRRVAVAAGIRAVRTARPELRRLLASPGDRRAASPATGGDADPRFVPPTGTAIRTPTPTRLRA